MKDIFSSNLESKKEIDLNAIFANPIYERLLGKREKIDSLFGYDFESVINELKKNLKLPTFTNQ